MSSPDSSIKLGSHYLSRIRYDQIKPGDIVCTYEALTTQPEIFHFQSICAFANPSRPLEFHRVFHIEVITHTYNRQGVYRIAHGDGNLQKIVAQDDDFRAHHPGQAFLIFRAKNKDIRREIIAVASKTSEPTNGHVCRALYLNSILHRKQYALTHFQFENEDSIHLTLKNIVELAANYEKNGTFYHSDGSGVKAMSCLQYVANIVNVAVLRKFCQIFKVDQRLNKINALFEQIVELNKSGGYPFKFSHTHSTPGAFVEFFLNNRSQFKPVGYLGAISERIEGPKLDMLGKAIKISPRMLKEVCVGSGVRNSQPDHYYIARVMNALGMIDCEWQLYYKPATDPVKLRTLLLWLNVHYPQSFFNFELLTLFSRSAHQNNRSVIEDLPPIISLSFQEIEEILLLERDILKESAMQSTEKTLKFSLNVLISEQKKIQEELCELTEIYQNFFAQSNSTVVSSSFTFFKIKQEENLRKMNEKLATCRKKIDELLVLHERVRENGCVVLISHTIPKGLRPWMHFSFNEGEWDVKPFILQQQQWIANFQIPSFSSVNYRIFIGPEDIEDPDPILKVQAWQRTSHDAGIFASSNAVGVVPDSDLLLVDTCIHPQWSDEKIPFNRAQKLFDYQQNCDAIAPFSGQPIAIDEYEKKYADLEESTLIPIQTSGLPYEEQIIVNLKTFLEAEVGMNVSLKQIQFMKGGLGKGLSGDRIYIILDHNQRPSLVVKVFMKSKGKFSREFLTLMNHEKLELKHLNLPEVAAISAAEIDQQRIYFLAIRYVTGVSVYEMFSALFDQKAGSPERQELLNNLLRIYAKLGNGIAEFHHAAQGETLPMHPAFIDLLSKFSQHAFSKFEEHLDPLFLKRLKNYFEGRFAYECTRPFMRGYFHGDINAGNLRYNFATDCLSLIDWPDGSSSVGQNGNPQGISFYDLIQIKNELATRKTQGLTEDEFSQLYESFMANYTKNGPLLPPPETMKFFSSIDMIGSLKWFLDKKEMFVQSHQLSTAQAIYEFKLNELKILVESHSTSKL